MRGMKDETNIFSDAAHCMVTEQMAANDHESFHLLQISESASDSLPDLDLVTLNTQHKKKKVRLKRFVL